MLTPLSRNEHPSWPENTLYFLNDFAVVTNLEKSWISIGFVMERRLNRTDRHGDRSCMYQVNATVLVSGTFGYVMEFEGDVGERIPGSDWN